MRIRQLLAFAQIRQPILAEAGRAREILAYLVATTAARPRPLRTSRGAP